MGTFNVCTVAFNSKDGIGHSEVIVRYVRNEDAMSQVSKRLDYILTRQVDRGLVRTMTVRKSPEDRHESDLNLVVCSIRLLGPFAPNRRVTAGR